MQKRILVIEDDPELVELLRFNLKRAGFHVGTAHDGVAGLKKARSLRPDLVLLDVMLPELDGIAVCETLRRDPAMASTPVVMLTAVSGQMARFSAIGAGADEYITKPFGVSQLVSRLRQILLQPRPSPADAAQERPKPNTIKSSEIEDPRR